MNKTMIFASLALVLTMTGVLVLGKTDKMDRASAAATSQKSDPGTIRPSIEIDAGSDILSREVRIPAQAIAALTISTEVNEAELILDQEWLLGPALSGASTSPLLESLARIQKALNKLERLANSTELAVAALES